ncbi:uncharacterized protein METZ01_LOCUS420963 [marine metagenome]|uniref:Uncharacterized protein n=1 Tax=marine metagenome TaxID=408172 RepID=A0A382XB55_9ZZZZ
MMPEHARSRVERFWVQPSDSLWSYGLGEDNGLTDGSFIDLPRWRNVVSMVTVVNQADKVFDWESTL